jgi:hypothetical protein
MLNQTEDYGVFYLKTVFPKGHRLEWMNYLHISNLLPEDLSVELKQLVYDINSKEGIVIPMDKGVDPGCVTIPEIIEDTANEVYNRFCEIFERLTSGNEKNCIRLVWGIGQIENVDYESTHDLPAYPIMKKVGRLLDSSKESGIFKA